MRSLAVDNDALRLDQWIRRFEQAWAEGSRPQLEQFLPPEDDSLQGQALVELIRVDLEYGWESGCPQPLAEYLARHPSLSQRPQDLQALAYEEYRLRCLAGQLPTPEEYRERFGVDVSAWPGPQRSVAPPNSPESDAKLPEVGDSFLGFRLLAELGRGSFGRVFLAQQADLASRRVVLKVGTDLFNESRSLAQLQHTHIVPIYSLHQCPPIQAVCMPYLGATTLADVLRATRDRKSLPASGKELVKTLRACQTARDTDVSSQRAGNDAGSAAVDSPSLPWQQLEQLGSVEAVLWMAARLAEGLAHAHARGILHRDLKPANVLITDEGQPMLLDFNLAEDVKLPVRANGRVGGTMPYMAPEQMEAFLGLPRVLDGRCDVYSLGVILYELLTGEQPFPSFDGPVDEAITRSHAARCVPPPSLRRLNPAVSPAAEAIVQHCLQADPSRRYRSARELREDLDRQVAHLPLLHAREPSLRELLAKWRRRHPRVIPALLITLIVAGIVASLGLAIARQRRRIAEFQAEDDARELGRQVRELRVRVLDHAINAPAELEGDAASARQLCRAFGIEATGDWTRRRLFRQLPAAERERLISEVRELLLLLARVRETQAQQSKDSSRRASLLNQARDWLLLAQVQTPGREERDSRIAQAMREGRFAEAAELLEDVLRKEPRSLGAWYDLGLCLERLGQDREAAGAFGACLALDPGLVHVLHKRAALWLRLKEHRRGLADLDEVLRQRPGDARARLNRALALLGLGREREALANLDRVLRDEPHLTHAYFVRAVVRARLGDRAGAAADRAEGLKREPVDEQGWLSRGAARLASEPQGALADFDRALVLNPRSLPALQNRAHVLAEHLHRPVEAVAALDVLIACWPDYLPARSSRAVILARLGRRDAAHRDAEHCRKARPTPQVRYQLAGVYALTSRQHPQDKALALRELASALRLGYGADLLDHDPDLAPLRQDPEFQRVAAAFRDLARHARP